MRLLVDFYDNRVFKTWNYKHFRNIDKPSNVILDSLAVLVGDFSFHRKRAAMTLLKAMVRKKFLNYLLEEESKELYPISRNDRRVRLWRNKVVERAGHQCERCGSTKKLEAHHILYWSEYPKGRIDVNNGMCLCYMCHALYHEGESSEGLILSKGDSHG